MKCGIHGLKQLEIALKESLKKKCKNLCKNYTFAKNQSTNVFELIYHVFIVAVQNFKLNILAKTYAKASKLH